MSLIIIIVSGMLLIVLSADYFTNGIEWLGARLKVNEGALGSLLAALGTALPETLVPVMALALGGSSRAQEGIGIGAILGAPFMLATLGFTVIGVGLWQSGRSRLAADLGPMRTDLQFFIWVFGLATVAGFVPQGWHRVIGTVLVVLYLMHAIRILSGARTAGESGAAPSSFLRFYQRPHPPVAWIWLQILLALFGLIIGAHFFVTGLEQIAAWLHWSGFLLAVIVTPVATELPEVLNSIIWLRRSRDQLALGNVTGAMAFQASVVPAIGMFFSPWQLSPWEVATAGLGWFAALSVWIRAGDGELRVRELLAAGLFYLMFLGLVLLRI